MIQKMKQYCRIGLANVNFNNTDHNLGRYHFQFCVAKYLQPKFGDWKDIDGIIGLNNNIGKKSRHSINFHSFNFDLDLDNEELNSFFSLFGNKTNKIFALELYNEELKSKIEKMEGIKRKIGKRENKQSILYIGKKKKKK